MFKDELVEDALHTGLPVTLKGRVHIWSRKTWLIGINQNCYIGASLMTLKSDANLIGMSYYSLPY